MRNFVIERPVKLKSAPTDLQVIEVSPNESFIGRRARVLCNLNLQKALKNLRRSWEIFFVKSVRDNSIVDLGLKTTSWCLQAIFNGTGDRNFWAIAVLTLDAIFSKI